MKGGIGGGPSITRCIPMMVAMPFAQLDTARWRQRRRDPGNGSSSTAPIPQRTNQAPFERRIPPSLTVARPFMADRSPAVALAEERTKSGLIQVVYIEQNQPVDGLEITVNGRRAEQLGTEGQVSLKEIWDVVVSERDRDRRATGRLRKRRDPKRRMARPEFLQVVVDGESGRLILRGEGAAPE